MSKIKLLKRVTFLIIHHHSYKRRLLSRDDKLKLDSPKQKLDFSLSPYLSFIYKFSFFGHKIVYKANIGLMNKLRNLKARNMRLTPQCCSSSNNIEIDPFPVAPHILVNMYYHEISVSTPPDTMPRY